MKSNFNKEQIMSDLNALFNSKTEDQLIERDALMLQANYLSEIERLTKANGINRKDIAFRIKTSPSYLTQVFRGDKPLNFITLAKIKRALNLRFQVTAFIDKPNESKDFKIETPVHNANRLHTNFTVIMGDKKLEMPDYPKYGLS